MVYKKVAFEHLLGISITNALLLFKDIKGITWSKATNSAVNKPQDFKTMLKFRESIIRALVGIKAPQRNSRVTRSLSSERAARIAVAQVNHRIVKTTEQKNNRFKTRTCCAPIGGPCREKFDAGNDGKERAKAKKKTSFYRQGCPSTTWVCFECIDYLHKDDMYPLSYVRPDQGQ